MEWRVSSGSDPGHAGPGHDQLLGLLNSTSAAVWAVDQDFRLTFVNQAGVALWKRFYGNEPRLGQPSSAQGDDPDTERWHDLYRRALAGESLELVFARRASGGDLQLDLSISPVTGASTSDAVVAVAQEAGPRHRALLETNAAATAIIAEDTTILFVNSEIERLLGVPKKEIEGKKSFAEFVHPDDLDTVRRNHELRRSDPETPPREYEFRLVHADGTVRHVFAVVGMLENTTHSIASLLDITAQRETRERLARYADHLRALHESAAELSGSIKDPHRIYRKALSLLAETVAFDSATVQLLEGGCLQVVACEGFADSEEVLSLCFDADDRYPNWRVVHSTSSIRITDVRDRFPHFIAESDSFSSGHIRSWLGVPLVAHDEVLGMIALDRADVRPFTVEEEQLVVTMANHVAGAVRNSLLYNRQLGYERELLEANRQKETLLRELHHRVKNNLQLVSSLIKLRADALADAEAHDALEELSLRVNSLAGIHEELYQSNAFDRVDLGEYAAGVVDQVVGLYPSQFALETRIEKGSAIAPVDVSVPFGLILSELVLNSVKHAFPDGRGGTLLVSLSNDSGTVVELEVQDDGVGIPEEALSAAPGGLGLELVRNLAEQIRAEVELLDGEGTRWRVTFPIPEPVSTEDSGV